MFRIFEIVFNLFYIRISDISKRIYFIAVCLFDPQQTFGNPLRTFGQSFASCVLKNREFFLRRRNFRAFYAGTSRVPPRVLAVWAKTLRGQKLKFLLPCHYVGKQTIDKSNEIIQDEAANLYLQMKNSSQFQ